MEHMKDEDRKRRLKYLEEKIQDPRSVINVDCLLVSLHQKLERKKNNKK